MDMQAIGKKISALRKERDMTQVDLADKIGVTYQAVSSWERGNSMPDIAKLPDISQALAVSIDTLLDNAKAAEMIKNVLLGQETSDAVADLETLADLAPILKPSQVHTLVKQTSQAKPEAKIAVNGEMLAQLAPHMESADLKKIALRCETITDDIISAIACHMDSEDLKEVAVRCENISAEAIAAIACQMDSGDIKEVALSCKNITGEIIAEIACQMDSADLKEVALHCENIDGATLEAIACQMDSADLKEVVLHCKHIDKDTLSAIACQMDSEDIADLILAHKV